MKFGLYFVFGILCVGLLGGCMEKPSSVMDDFTSPEEGIRPVFTENDHWICELAPIRQTQMTKLLQEARLEPPPMMTNLMASAAVADWAGVSNAWQHLDFLHGFGMDPDSNVPAAVRSAAYHPANEMAWFFGLLRSEWPPELLNDYLRETLDVLPEHAMVLAGSAGARYIWGGFRDIRGMSNLVVITQNQLVDATYLDYVRLLAPETLWIPTGEDHAAAFQTVVEDIRSGRAGSDVGVVDAVRGKVNLNWPEGAMWVNGLLARSLLERNKTQTAFFVEEEAAIPWMRDYMKPAGAWLQLMPSPVESLSPVEIAADMAYWNALEAKLMGQAGFIQSVWPRAAWAGLRVGAGSIYAHRRMWPEATQAFEQAIRLDPGYAPAHFRLATEVLVPQGRLNEALSHLEEVRRVNPESDLCDRWILQIRAMQVQSASSGDDPSGLPANPAPLKGDD